MAPSMTLEKPRLNKKKGTAVIPATVEAPGEVSLSGKSLVPFSKAADSAGAKIDLKVKAKGQAADAISEGKRYEVKVSVAYKPDVGETSVTTRLIKLQKKN